MMKNNWKSIWLKKGQNISEKNNLSLIDLIKADGFDSGAGDHTLESWKQFTALVIQKMGICDSNQVLDVGCGGGAFIMPIYEVGAKVFGIDYSDSLIKLAKHAMPSGEFQVAEANSIPFDSEQFDVVLSHSIFQYFPSVEYAQKVISEISRVLVKGGKAAILDINDAQKKEQFFEIRMAKIGKEQYKEKYDAYPHRFYEKKWFLDSCNDLGLKASIEDQAIEAYGNSKFRFNVYIES